MFLRMQNFIDLQVCILYYKYLQVLLLGYFHIFPLVSLRLYLR